jgi:hypothetical protein
MGIPYLRINTNDINYLSKGTVGFFKTLLRGKFQNSFKIYTLNKFIYLLNFRKENHDTLLLYFPRLIIF